MRRDRARRAGAAARAAAPEGRLLRPPAWHPLDPGGRRAGSPAPESVAGGGDGDAGRLRRARPRPRRGRDRAPLEPAGAELGRRRLRLRPCRHGRRSADPAAGSGPGGGRRALPGPRSARGGDPDPDRSDPARRRGYRGPGGRHRQRRRPRRLPWTRQAALQHPPGRRGRRGRRGHAAQGHRLRPPDLALLSAVGAARVPCIAGCGWGSCPRATRSRRIPAMALLDAGRIYDANRPMLLAMAERWGYLPVDLAAATTGRRSRQASTGARTSRT